MRRFLVGVLVGLSVVASSFARAEDGALSGEGVLVNRKFFADLTEKVHDAVAANDVNHGSVLVSGRRLADGINGATPDFRQSPMPIERERPTGELGTVKGMFAEGKLRYELFKRMQKPGKEFAASMEFADKMVEEGRIDFNRDGTMAPNKLGEYRYNREDPSQGRIQLSPKLAVIAAYVGDALTYSTVIHEVTHARKGAERELSPKAVVDGEVAAYKVQHDYIKAVDRKAERMSVLYSSLGLLLKEHPGNQQIRMSRDYVQHLLDIYDTDGEDPKLRELVRRLDYKEGDTENPQRDPSVPRS